MEAVAATASLQVRLRFFLQHLLDVLLPVTVAVLLNELVVAQLGVQLSFPVLIWRCTGGAHHGPRATLPGAQRLPRCTDTTQRPGRLASGRMHHNARTRRQIEREREIEIERQRQRRSGGAGGGGAWRRLDRRSSGRPTLKQTSAVSAQQRRPAGHQRNTTTAAPRYGQTPNYGDR